MFPDEINRLAREVVEGARRRGWTVTAAESCTGGLVSAALTDVPGASDVLERSLVTYSNAAKTALLRWPEGAVATDDVAVFEAAGGRVALVPGDPALMKLTYPEDFAMAEALMTWETRMGLGLDAHRWGPGDTVWLCGVPISHDQTLMGHSDADAGLHALTDAILGAIGDGDIGDHFPPTDPQWKGARSDQFLVHAVERVRARGGRLVNVDVTLVCEQPRIKPHRAAMKARLAELLGLPLDAVSVKATTTEGMGFAGRQEGLAAQAIAAVALPVRAAG